MQNDVTYLAIILGLFAVMLALVKVCDLIIGSEETAMDAEGSGEPGPMAGVEDDEPAVAA